MGFGTGSVVGTVGLVTTMGYGIGTVSEPVPRRICGLIATVRDYDLTASVRSYNLSAEGCE